MDQHGALTSFLLCKLGVALAVATLIGAVATMSMSFERTAQREDLGEVVEHVIDALEEIDGTPGRVWIERDLPAVGKEFELVVTGAWDGAQIVRVGALGEENIERATVLLTAVNGGEFALSCRNPTRIQLTKDGQTGMEVI